MKTSYPQLNTFVFQSKPCFQEKPIKFTKDALEPKIEIYLPKISNKFTFTKFRLHSSGMSSRSLVLNTISMDNYYYQVQQL